MSKTKITKSNMDSYWKDHPLLNTTIEEFKMHLSEFIPEYTILIEELYQEGFSVSETVEALSLEDEKK